MISFGFLFYGSLKKRVLPLFIYFFYKGTVLMADLVLQYVHPLSASRHISAPEAIANFSQNERKVGQGHAPS